MQLKAIIFSMVLLFTFFNANSQKDVKRLNAVKVALDEDKDFNKALNLLGKISEEGQKLTDYQLLLAKANAGAGNFEQSVLAYQRYEELNPSDTSTQSAINSLKHKLEIRKNCTVCKGSGYITTEAICPTCNGLVEMTIPCKKCGGQKTIPCSACDGSGKISSGPYSVVACSSCGGSGKKECMRCNSTGTAKEMCKYCKGGYIIQKVRCTAHE